MDCSVEGGTPGTYCVKRYGFKYLINVDDPVMEEHYKRGELCEQAMLDWIVANVPKGGVWVDCGANVGEHTLVYATAMEAFVTYAFEPAPMNHDRLLYNTRDLAQGGVIPLAMGVGLGPERMGLINTAQGRASQIGLSGHGLIPVVCLDAIVPPRDVRLIKVDVEGMEFKVLRGAAHILAMCQPELFVEIWTEVNLADIRAYLDQFGYQLIECWNDAPTFHFSASGRYPVTYQPRQLQ